MKFTFKICESTNELEKRAKWAKKRQKGLSPFVKLDAGNVEYNQAVFNASTSGESCCEDLEQSNIPDDLLWDIVDWTYDEDPYEFKDNYNDDYDFYNELVDTINDENYMKQLMSTISDSVNEHIYMTDSDDVSGQEHIADGLNIVTELQKYFVNDSFSNDDLNEGLSLVLTEEDEEPEEPLPSIDNEKPYEPTEEEADEFKQISQLPYTIFTNEDMWKIFQQEIEDKLSSVSDLNNRFEYAGFDHGDNDEYIIPKYKLVNVDDWSRNDLIKLGRVFIEAIQNRILSDFKVKVGTLADDENIVLGIKPSKMNPTDAEKLEAKIKDMTDNVDNVKQILSKFASSLSKKIPNAFKPSLLK